MRWMPCLVLCFAPLAAATPGASPPAPPAATGAGFGALPEANAERFRQHIFDKMTSLKDAGLFEGLNSHLDAQMRMLGYHVFTSYYPPTYEAVIAAADQALDPAANSDHPTALQLCQRLVDKVMEVVGHRAMRIGATPGFPINPKAGPPAPEFEARTEGSLWILRFAYFGGDDPGQCNARPGLAVPPAGAEGIVIDLRGNGGGSLASIDCVASYFLKSGTPLYVVKSANDAPDERVASDRAVKPTRLPAVVIIDPETFTGGLVFAAALSDNHRAKLIGTAPTDIDGTVRITTFLLGSDARGSTARNDAIQVQLPIGELARLRGAALAAGLVPDLEMPTENDAALLDAAARQMHVKRR